VRIVDLILHQRPGAGADECNAREYWRLKNGEAPRLLAIDCIEQRSAEEAAAATTEIAKGDFLVNYVEYQASDQCERYQARISLATLAVRSEARWEGTSDARGCRAKKRLKKLAPKGDGDSGEPILRLHVTWADLNRAR
jgi:hypothetical protein